MSSWLANNTRMRPEDPARGRSWTAKTRNRELAALKAFYRWATDPDQALMPRSPAENVRTLKVSEALTMRFSHRTRNTRGSGVQDGDFLWEFRTKGDISRPESQSPPCRPC